MLFPIAYTVCPRSPEKSVFDVTVEVELPNPLGQGFALPVWIPGSYMVREFSKHLMGFRAFSGDKPLAVYQTAKNRWQVEPCAGVLTICYSVYAFDLSVRGAYLDEVRGFFNGANLLVTVEGAEDWPCSLHIQRGEAKALVGWRVATNLHPHNIDKVDGFGFYSASNYDELIDFPVELGCFDQVEFVACGVRHQFVVSGHHHGDLARLARDVKQITEYQIRFFGEPAPFSSYLFLLHVGKGLYGGLEHRSSTALLCDRDNLPLAHEKNISDDYLGLLALISHEYFHSWNVKRIKPKAFSPYNLDVENYTTLLWAFEGITSYYDDLVLVRCGLIEPTRYLGRLAETTSTVYRGGGRKQQTLAASSWEAWTKYYRQDENSPNSIVSYYAKGALVALALDLTIRQQSGGTQSLDDVMRALWQKWLQDQQGIEEHEWEAFAQQITGLNLTAFFDEAIRSTQDLPLETLLATQGVQLYFDAPQSASDRGGYVSAHEVTPASPSLGVKAVLENRGLRLVHVYEGGAAQSAGLAGGDVIIAIDGIQAVELDKMLARYCLGDRILVHFFRRDQLYSKTLQLQAAPEAVCHLQLMADTPSWLNDKRFFQSVASPISLDGVTVNTSKD